jgi:hypothetical protein
MTTSVRLSSMLVAWVMITAVAVPSVAQDVGTMRMPMADVSLGYVFMSHETTDAPERYPRGWYVGMAGNVTQWFSIVGEASGSYRADDSTFTLGLATVDETRRKREHTLMAGPRFYHKVGRVVPFAQLLTGISVHRVEQSTNVTGSVPWAGRSGVDRQTNLFGLQPGGGVGVLLTERVGVRVGADYRALFDFGEGSTFHEFRMLTGFTFHWGGR